MICFYAYKFFGDITLSTRLNFTLLTREVNMQFTLPKWEVCRKFAANKSLFQNCMQESCIKCIKCCYSTFCIVLFITKTKKLLLVHCESLAVHCVSLMIKFFTNYICVPNICKNCINNFPVDSVCQKFARNTSWYLWTKASWEKNSQMSVV